MFDQILQLVKEHLGGNPQIASQYRPTRQMRCTMKLPLMLQTG